MIGATLLSKDVPIRQRALLSKKRVTRLQGSELQPFDEIYTVRWRTRRMIADVKPTPDAEHDFEIRLAPRGGKPADSDLFCADWDDWFTVHRAMVPAKLLRWAAGAPSWGPA